MNIYLAGTYSRSHWVFDEMDIYLAGRGVKAKNIDVHNERMNIYLAGEHEVKNGKAATAHNGLLILESYVYARDNKHITSLIPTFKSFLLDSGAYTFMIQARKQDVLVDWNEYIEQYAAFILQHNVDLFFELDIDRIVGLSEVERLRGHLERLTGKPSIPVWHRSRGLDYFKAMCRDYPYVSLSASGNNGSSEWTRTADGTKVLRQLIDIAHDAGARVHGLGYTNVGNLRFLKFDSVDSTSWLMGNRGGFLWFFTGSTIVTSHKPEGTRLKAREVAQHNFDEWVKFQQYAEKHL